MIVTLGLGLSLLGAVGLLTYPWHENDELDELALYLVVAGWVIMLAGWTSRAHAVR